MKKSFTIFLFFTLVAFTSLLFYTLKTLEVQSGTLRGVSLSDLSAQNKTFSRVYADSPYEWRIAHPSTWSVKDPEQNADGFLFEKTEIVSDETHAYKRSVDLTGDNSVLQQGYHTHETNIGKVAIGLHRNDESTHETLTFIRQTYDQIVFKDTEAYTSTRRSVRDDLQYYAKHIYIIPENKDYYYVLSANASNLTEETLQKTIDTLHDMLNSFTPV